MAKWQPPDPSIANRIGQRMRQLGWVHRGGQLHLAKLADESGIGAAQVTNIMRSRRVDMRASTLTRIADALGVSVDWLLGRKLYY